MPQLTADVADLTRDLVALDSRSFVSNLAVAERIETALAGFDIERLDYTDPAGVAKRVLVAHRGGGGRGIGSVRPHGHGARHRLAGRSLVGADRRRRHATRARQHRHEGSCCRRHRRRPFAPAARARHPADHHRRGDHQAGRPADRVAVGPCAAGEAARHPGGGADQPDPGARPPCAHRLYLRRPRGAGAQQHRQGPQRQLGADPVPGRDEGGVRAPARRSQPAGSRTTIRHSATSTW